MQRIKDNIINSLNVEGKLKFLIESERYGYLLKQTVHYHMTMTFTTNIWRLNYCCNMLMLPKRKISENSVRDKKFESLGEKNNMTVLSGGKSHIISFYANVVFSK